VRSPENVRLLSKSVLAVVGGTGRMGRLLVRLLKKDLGKVIICSRDFSKAKRIAAVYNVEAGSLKRISEANIVIVSVPVENTYKTCEDALKIMKANSLLIDIASAKTGVTDKLTQILPEQIEYMSAHPLFGPTPRKIGGENMLVIPVKAGPLSKAFINLMRKKGLNVVDLTVEEHDKKTALTQALHHFALISLAVSLTEFSDGNLNNFTTRSLRKTLTLLKSFVNNLDSILAIQLYNPFASDLRRNYLKIVSDLCQMDEEAIARIRRGMNSLMKLTAGGKAYDQ
jgi:prephenate dehydrogenase